MRILEKYILKSTSKAIFGCLFIFLLLYIVADLFSNLDQVIKQKTELSIIILYYFTYLPVIFVQMIGFACLFGVVYNFAVLNRNNEIIAMRTSGLSIFWISRTVIVLALLISLFSVWLNVRIIPEALAKIDNLKSKIQKKPSVNIKIIKNISFYGLKNRLFFVNTFYSEENILEGVVVLEHDKEHNLIKKIVADRAIFKDGLWYFYRCITYYFDAEGNLIQEPVFSKEEIFGFSEKPQDFLKQRQKPELMKVSELDEYIWKLSRSKATSAVRNFKLEFYQRFILGFNSLFLVLLGIPFAIQIKIRTAGLYSLGIAIILGFIYYAIHAISIALGKAGIISPFLSCTIAPLSSLGLSGYLLLKKI